MTLVPRDAPDEALLSIVHGWIEALARQDYAAAFAALGYALAHGEPGADCIRRQIQSYRSPELYPGVTNFTLTDWRTATGGNPNPLQLIRRYKANDTGLIATIELHLPLNGRWSDLEADFVIFDNQNSREGYFLSLEEISSSRAD
jgi:hypothetical protein